MTPCIHSPTGLCESCLTAFEEDPTAWAEWGNHPAGEANWAALQAELETEALIARGRSQALAAFREAPPDDLRGTYVHIFGPL